LDIHWIEAAACRPLSGEDVEGPGRGACRDRNTDHVRGCPWEVVMNRKYELLFEISVEHDYFQNRDPDMQLLVPGATRKRLARAGLLWRSFGSKLSVVVPSVSRKSRALGNRTLHFSTHFGSLLHAAA